MQEFCALSLAFRFRLVYNIFVRLRKSAQEHSKIKKRSKNQNQKGTKIMKKARYMAKWSYSNWRQGSGWALQDSIIDTYEEDIDHIDRLIWDDKDDYSAEYARERFVEWLAEQDEMADMNDEELARIAEAEDEDTLYAWDVYAGEEIDEDRKIDKYHVEAWRSEVAKMVLEQRNND